MALRNFFNCQVVAEISYRNSETMRAIPIYPKFCFYSMSIAWLYPEIAKLVEIPEGIAKSSLHQVLAAVRA